MNIDKKLENIGFKKIKEDKKQIIYNKDKCYDCLSEDEYTHEIIIFNYDGEYYIFSSQKETNKEGFQNAICLTENELRLVFKKIKQWKISNKLKLLMKRGDNNGIFYKLCIRRH